jgi:hypothetical protein
MNKSTVALTVAVSVVVGLSPLVCMSPWALSLAVVALGAALFSGGPRNAHGSF